MKVYHIAASEHGLWIIERVTYQPYRYDFKGSFRKAAPKKAWSIAVGLEGQVAVRDYTSRELYSLVGGSWQRIGTKVSAFSFG